MPRQVYIEPIWKFHAFGTQLAANPPSGYEFVTSKTSREKLFDTIGNFNAGMFALKSIDRFLPTRLVKSWLEKFDATPVNSRLTYACDHLVFRPEPWVIEVEYASLVLGIDPKHLLRYKKTMEKALSSPNCKKILCWAETGRHSLLADLDSRGFHHKVEVVHYAVPAKSFVKAFNNGKTKLLFVGSGTSKGGFDFRGGREAIASFARLRQRYRDIEMTVRSDVPADVKARYYGLEGLRLLEDMIPREEMVQEFLTADIFLIPSHNTSPMIILDAMSYELPVVTKDFWANPEYVEDGKTGLVAMSSGKLAYFYKDTRQPNWTDKGFQRAIQDPDPAVVEDLANKISRLIDNPELRRRLGKAARREVEKGKFSLKKMNKKLAGIFDEAIDGDRASVAGSADLPGVR